MPNVLESILALSDEPHQMQKLREAVQCLGDTAYLVLFIDPEQFPLASWAIERVLEFARSGNCWGSVHGICYGTEHLEVFKRCIHLPPLLRKVVFANRAMVRVAQGGSGVDLGLDCPQPLLM